MNTASSDLLLESPLFPEDETGQARHLDYLGYAPCPLRNELRQRLHAQFLAAREEGQTEAAWYMPAGCHTPNPYDALGQTEDADLLPGLISETGFGDFNSPLFRTRWLDSGVYKEVGAGLPRREFQEAGLVDPRGLHRVVGANVELILVDLERLGDRPLPRTWADVLHARFRRDIIVSGEAGDIHESLLYSLYKDHGEAGLEALGANVRDFMHPAQMVKQAGANAPQGAALYLLPNFFAQSSPHREHVSVVWPEEGAYLTPQYVLRRSDAGPSADLIRDFLCGLDWAQHLSRVGFAAAHPEAPALPGRLRWVGWDFVRSHDLAELGARLNAAFVRGHKA